MVRRTHLTRERSDCGKMGHTRRAVPLKGQPINAPDGLIAATALEHDLIIVTRNVKDFDGLGVEILNPWET